MQLSDVVIRNTVGAKVVINPSTIPREHVLFGQLKKLLVELTNQVFFQKVLEAKKDDFLHVWLPGFSWSQV
jgi:hypothetical protein